MFVLHIQCHFCVVFYKCCNVKIYVHRGIDAGSECSWRGWERDGNPEGVSMIHSLHDNVVVFRPVFAEGHVVVYG